MQPKSKTAVFQLLAHLLVFAILPYSCNVLAQKNALAQISTSKQKELGKDEEKNSDFLPLEITPEGLIALKNSGEFPFVLINSAPQSFMPEHDGRIRRIYYSTGVSVRVAKNMVLQDREKLGHRSDQTTQPSQRLTGTPIEWQQLDIPMVSDALPKKPVLISPKELSEAIRDEVDFQVIDLRPPQIFPPSNLQKQKKNHEKATASPFPQALSLMPHQIESALPEISKKRWLILVDDGQHEAQMIANQLFEKGFVLVGVLDGGYPAWVAATDK